MENIIETMDSTADRYEAYSCQALGAAWVSSDEKFEKHKLVAAQVYATLAVAAATERMAIAQEEANKKVVTARMVDRFLQWKLPTGFAPDCGIYYVEDSIRQPTGTNLLTATQAKEMLEFILG
jgi:hypothetical protein